MNSSVRSAQRFSRYFRNTHAVLRQLPPPPHWRGLILASGGIEHWNQEPVEQCLDMTAKLPVIYTTACMQTICNMNNSIPNINMSQYFF